MRLHIARNVRAAGFDPEMRCDVADLAAQHPHLADLTLSFPGLLFALASSHGTAAERNQAIALVKAGAPLRVISERLGLPYWLRRVPASAFSFHLAKLPTSPAHSRRLIAVIPQSPANLRNWLWAVHYATSAGNDDFGVWIAEQAAKHPSRFRGAPGRMALRHLTAWAWHADHPDTPGHALLLRPWSPEMGFRRAMEEMCRWRARVDLARTLTHRSTQNRWIKDGEALGYTFTELVSIQDFISEAAAMDNCLDQFSNQLVTRESQIFSISSGDRPLANVEVGRHDGETTMPTILQLRGPRNRRASGRIWQATYAWLGSQRLKPRRMTLKRPDPRRAIQSFNQSFWTPYVTELRDAGLPLQMWEEVVATFHLDRTLIDAPASPKKAQKPTGATRKTKATTPAKTPSATGRRKAKKRT
ncbi:MAG: hypothetical protein AAFV45_12895 [Pseudomonadota bacterium]